MGLGLELWCLLGFRVRVTLPGKLCHLNAIGMSSQQPFELRAMGFNVLELWD